MRLIHCFIVLFSLSAFAQVEYGIDWEYSYGGSDVDKPWDICRTADGAFVIVGHSLSYDGDVVGANTTYGTGWVIKIDPAGLMQWQRPYGGSAGGQLAAVAESDDGSLFFGGNASAPDPEGTVIDSLDSIGDLWVVKTDAAGTIIWQRLLGGTGAEYARGIDVTSDGGCVVIGQTNSNDGDVTDWNVGSSGGMPTWDTWVVKLDAGGATEWTKCLGSSEQDAGHSVQQTSDGGYIIAGYLGGGDGDGAGAGYHGGEADAWIVKLNAAGSIEWQKALGGTGTDSAVEVRCTSDGGYVFAGYTNSENGDVSGEHNGTDGWVVKLDAMGDIQWQRPIGGGSELLAYCIRQHGSGYYLAAGRTDSNDGDVSGNHGASDAWVSLLDSAGTVLGSIVMGGSHQGGAWALELTNDSSCIVVCSDASIDGDVTGNHGYTDYWVVGLGWQQVLGLAENAAAPLQMLYDRSSGLVTVSASMGNTALIMVDGQGRVVRKAAPENGTYRIDVRELAPGAYTLTLNDGRDLRSRTFVIE